MPGSPESNFGASPQTTAISAPRPTDLMSRICRTGTAKPIVAAKKRRTHHARMRLSCDFQSSLRTRAHTQPSARDRQASGGEVAGGGTEGRRSRGAEEQRGRREEGRSGRGAEGKRGGGEEGQRLGRAATAGKHLGHHMAERRQVT